MGRSPARPRPLLLDVREPWEFQTCHIDGAAAMPMRTVPARLAELDPDLPVVSPWKLVQPVTTQVAGFLEQNGFADVSNLTGGVHAWALQVDPKMPTY